MGKAKDILIKPIDSKTAHTLVRKIHYSGKSVNNSKLHLGVFYEGKLEGVMQFGSPLDKRKSLGLVKDTKWYDMLELNRMAFSEKLPRNSESRALGIAFKIIKKQYPNIEWILSFSDGTQCGDGTIYRASGFLLTQINQNKTIWEAPDGRIATDLSLRLQSKNQRTVTAATVTKGAKNLGSTNGAASMKPFKDAGWKPKAGFQLRYVRFLHESARQRLTVEPIPFSEIDKMGAGMYKGENVTLQSRREKHLVDAGEFHSPEGGSSPTLSLQSDEREK